LSVDLSADALCRGPPRAACRQNVIGHAIGAPSRESKHTYNVRPDPRHRGIVARRHGRSGLRVNRGDRAPALPGR
jgi:hypothetical protein